MIVDIRQLHLEDFLFMWGACALFGIAGFFGRSFFTWLISKKTYKHPENQPFSAAFATGFFKFFFFCSLAANLFYVALLLFQP